MTRILAHAALVTLLACRATPEEEPEKDTATDTGTGPVGDSDTAVDSGETADTADSGDTDTDTTTPPVAPLPLSVKPAIVDTSGGGGRVVIEVDDTTGATGASLGGVALTEFVIDDATHVSGTPGAHAAGVVDVSVVSAAGTGTTPGLVEYWTPAQIPDVKLYLDAGKGTATGSGGELSAWVDQGPDARSLTQADPAHQPVLVPDSFGTLPAIRFTPDQYVRLSAPVEMLDGSSIFAVARWTATTDVSPPPGNAGNVPLTLVGDGVNAYGAFGASGGQIESNHYTGGPNLVHGGEGLNDGVVRLIGATYDTRTTTTIYVGNTQQGVDDVTSPFIGLNTWDTVGAGHPGADGWDGDVGAVVIVSGVLPRDERTRLDLWAQQRWGTPESPPVDTWTREVLTEMPLTPDTWQPRDGAQMVQLASGRVLMLGGWSPYDPWDGARTTNEVWASDDDGVTWSLLLPHDPDPPKEGPGARFPPGHTVGVTTWNGHAVVMGTDCLSAPLLGEVWVEADDGETWERVTADAPTTDRCLFMAANLDEDLYMMGGQANLYDADTAIADVWRSSDGGVTWTQLDAPPWSGRGMVYRPVVVDDRLVIVGGGRYDEVTCVAFNGVFAFDGSTWTTVLPDGHDQWEASYYNAEAVLDGRLWLFNGYTGTEELSRALYSDDGGTTWSEYPGGSGGVASHADAAVALESRILRVSGNLSAREVYAFEP